MQLSLDRSLRIYVAGHNGMLGSSFVRRLKREGFENLLLPTRAQLDLSDRRAVFQYFNSQRPDLVLMCAGRVGGILANETYPAEFLIENLSIATNIIEAAYQFAADKVVYFGCACMYPRDCPQPMKETGLLTGVPDATSLPYAMAKLTGMQLCLAHNRQYENRRFLVLIPNNTFGPNDNFELASSHVVPALIRKFSYAVQNGIPLVRLWGSGQPRREFIYADDVVDATLHMLEAAPDYPEPVNLGVGVDYTIAELAATVARVTGFTGTIEWDRRALDGVPAKLLNSDRISEFGWRPRYSLEQGIRETVDWFQYQERSDFSLVAERENRIREGRESSTWRPSS